jgi:hypothetical protein
MESTEHNESIVKGGEWPQSGNRFLDSNGANCNPNRLVWALSVHAIERAME